jgi:vacuolar-type H+-ATPase subunit H
MSDILEKLLGVEKNAAAIVAEAEAEAHRRMAQARGETQKRSAETLKKKTTEGDEAVAAERSRIAAERERQNKEYREKMTRHSLDTAAFSHAVFTFIEKGGR